MRIKNALSAVLVLLLVSGSAIADFERIEDRLTTLLGADAEWELASTPIDGLIQVTLGSDVFFLTEDGQFFVQGRLVNLDTQDDLSELAKRGIRLQALETLDQSTLITYGPDKADYELLIFTDTDCGYCRRLHDLVADYNELGIRVSYAAFPRAGIGSPTYDDLVSVWCAEQPAIAMNRAQAGQSLEPRQCDNPVRSHFELGRQFAISGTPTMVTPFGELIGGLVQPDDLRSRLDAAAERAETIAAR